MKTAIEIALNNGWDMFGYSDWPWCMALKSDHLLVAGENYCPEQVIFNLDFAKALFGEGKTMCRVCGATHHEDSLHEAVNTQIGDWQYHLQQLALSTDRQKYLDLYVEGL